jgi:hypothetical protein
LTAAALMLAGCKDYEADALIGKSVQVELAYSFSSSAAGNQTRQSDLVVTSDDTNPRMPQYMRLIPLINNNPVFADISWNDPVDKDNPRSRFYHSRYCNLALGVNGFLVYGNVVKLSPTDGISTNMYNGSLIEKFPSVFNDITDIQEGISFELDPIYKSIAYSATDGIPEGAQALADCLTAIATKENFHESTDHIIKGFFDKFTNNGNHLPGSAASIRKWIETFITSIPEAPGDLLNAVKEEANNRLSDIASLTYPRDINLPDGAAVLRWVDFTENNVSVKKFVPQINTTTIDNINSIARFAYPAPLYYYIASAIKTSEEKVDFETIYNDEATTAWSKVLEDTKFNKTSVSANTKAVALTNPVQYAVAQLKVKIKAYKSTLKDAANQDVSVNSTQFPLKGIIVCDQRPVDYRFVPKEVEQGTISDAEVLFIYDNQVKTDCYLRPQDEDVWVEGCNTLVLQSLKGEDVNIILEFENNSGSPFTCIDGIVYPDTRFYMIGRVEASLYNTLDPNVHDENKGQVFTKDYITTVNMTVNSLARAYNVPPNLLSPNLEIGVETTPQWEGATPTVIRLDK